MKRFAFRLERLRELRERAERERAAGLGHAMREEQARQDTLTGAQRDALRLGEHAAALPTTGAVHAGFLLAVDAARGAAEQRVDAATDALREAGEHVDAERDRYGAARRELRVVEKLKARRFEAWRERGAREERKETDEAAQHRHSTKEERP